MLVNECLSNFFVISVSQSLQLIFVDIHRVKGYYTTAAYSNFDDAVDTPGKTLYF
jgi:hypothetical protein